nr:MAG TPA: hypothetical protein [Caudoviricetes sp.]
MPLIQLRPKRFNFVVFIMCTKGVGLDPIPSLCFKICID